MTDQQPRLFQIWLDASDGSIATYDGVQWPDGTADIHHRHRRPDGIQWSPETLAQQVHGKQARIEWADDATTELRQRAEQAEATLAAIREYLECSDDDGIRTREQVLGMLDQAGVPSVVAEELAGADRYAAMVNAPLRPETIAAINKRIKSGDMPVRKVRLRDRGGERAEEQPTLTPEQLARGAAEGVDTAGCDCGHDGMGVSWHRDWCAWRKARKNHGPDSPASGSRG